ncbi:MAG TPA: glycosyltransferase family 39 protein [Myxococcota bacterium]
MAQRAVLAVFAACLFASLFWIVHPWYDMTIDGSIYIVTARSLAAGEGYRYLGEPFQVRPPGFPLLIVPFLAGLKQDFFAINFFVGCFGAAGVLLLIWHARPRLGLGLALLTAAAVWLNPNYQRLSTQVMSDVPGTTLLLLCLLVERWASARPTPRREIALGLAIGLSAYVRMNTILLVPAILLSRLLRRGAPGPMGWTASLAAQRLLLFASVAVLALVPWSIRNRLDPAPSPAEQTLLYSYGVANWHADPGDPESPLLPWTTILERIPLRTQQLASVLGSRMREEAFRTSDPVDGIGTTRSAVSLLLLGCSLVLLVRRREPAEFFVAGMAAVIVTYFAFAPRLVLPVFLVTLPAAVEVVRDLVARAAGARAGAALAAAGLLAMIGIDFSPRQNWDLIESQYREFGGLSQAVASAVDPAARLGAVVGAHYSVFLERPVYSIQIVTRRANNLEAADGVIERNRLDTIVLSNRTPLDQQFAEYFQRRYGAPERVGPALIFRIPPRSR